MAGCLMRVKELNSVGASHNVWTKLPTPIIADSGACDSVMPAEWADNYPAERSGREGVTSYVAANGEKVPNLGEKTLNVCTSEGQYSRMKFQLAPVNQALCSVSGLCNGGNRVVFEADHGYIENLQTGSITWLECRDGLYVLETDIAPHNDPDFVRPA